MPRTSARATRLVRPGTAVPTRPCPRSVLAMWGSARRLLVLAAALAGLFAMHGLSDHGSTGEHGMALAEQHTVMSEELVSQAIDAPLHPGSGMAAVGGCLAFLALLWMTFASRRAVRSTSAASLAFMHPSFWPVVRERGPPDRASLSVYRC